MNISSLWMSQRKLRRADQVPGMVLSLCKGEVLPPLELLCGEDGEVQVQDGHHRLVAYWLKGRRGLDRHEYGFSQRDQFRPRFGGIGSILENSGGVKVLLMEVIESLHAHLETNPADWDTRLVLADAYEEIGEDRLARLQRWLVREKKYPGIWETRVGNTFWWYATRGWRVRPRDHDCLGLPLWTACRLHSERKWTSRKKIELLILEGLEKLNYPRVEITCGDL